MNVKGFTLIEAMVAVTILSLSVAGPLYIANRAVVAAQIARDQLTASYLTQEGVEYVRTMRDNEYLAAYRAGGANVSDDAWNNFTSASMSNRAGNISQCRTSTCTLDSSRPMGTGGGSSLQPCAGASCTPLYIRNGIYTQRSGGGGVQTPFKRTVQAFDVPGNVNEETIVSTVSWNFHGTQYSVTISDHLTPWQ